MIDALRDAAARVPDQALVLGTGMELSYAACVDRSERIAGSLSRRGMDRFGAVIDDAGSAISVLAGAAATGSEACLYSPLWPDERIEQVAHSFGHSIVVSDRTIRSPHREVVSVGALGSGPSPRFTGNPVASEVLILTSGTTGEPKGARHEWSTLLASVRHPDDEPGHRWLLVYNLNQYAGYQLLAHVVRSAATLVITPSRRPADVASTITRFQVTHVSATPTMWRLLIGSIDKQTASEMPIRQITLGGEAASDALLDDLSATFPRARISQVYAATEFGRAIAVHDGRSGLPLTVLEDRPDADVQMRIVDGELQIRSRWSMLGYYLEDRKPEGWRPTGDLVEVRGDRLCFVGRVHDRINVGGVKVYPLPIEERIMAVPGVLLVRVYGRPSPVTGEIVAADVVPVAGADPTAVEARIRAAFEGLGPAERPRRIRFVAELPVQGDKVVRRGEVQPDRRDDVVAPSVESSQS